MSVQAIGGFVQCFVASGYVCQCYFEEVRVIVAGESLEYFSMVWHMEVMVFFVGSTALHLTNRNRWGWLY